MGCSQKNFHLVWRCQQPLSGFLANDHLPRMSRLPANDMGDDEMKPGVVHRSPGIYLKAEEKSGPQLGDPSHEGYATSNRLKMGSPNYK